jgi:hypothetical protein
MKYKFKPSIGGNRARKGAVGGGRKEEHTPRNEKLPPTVAAVDLQQGCESQHEVQTACTASSEDIPTTRDSSTGGVSTEGVCTAQSGAVAGKMREESCEGEEVEASRSGELEQPTSHRGKTVSNASVRPRKRVAPTVTSSRPRRPRQGNTTCDKPVIELDGPVSINTTSLTTCPSSSSEVVRNCPTSGPRPSVGAERPVTRYSHALGKRKDLAEEARQEKMISDALDNVLNSQLAPDESIRSTGDGNLSGVVRSSLDLVCPPPMGDEGATFELSREESRLNPACGSSGARGEGPRAETLDGSAEREGEEREREEEQDIAATTREEKSGDEDRSEATSEQRGNSKTRARKRQSHSDKSSPDEASQVAKKRKTGVSRSPTKLKKAPDRASMTMQELIYYNPSANPMSSSLEQKKRKSQLNETSTEDTDNSSQPPSRVPTPAPLGSDVSSEVSSDACGESHDSGRLVPQLRMRKDGRIVLDEESMVVATTARPMVFDDPLNPPLIEGCGHTTSASYRKSCRVNRWTTEETTQFFRALSRVGTDFTMMTLLLPKRSRKELKNKFKKEEKTNPHRVSQALKSQVSVKPTHEPQTEEHVT